MWLFVHLLLTSIDTQFSDWVRANHRTYATPADAAARKANFAANPARIEASNNAVNATRAAFGPIEVPALSVMIVGGSRGIGYQLTKQYAERGHDVHTTYREHVPPSLQQRLRRRQKLRKLQSGSLQQTTSRTPGKLQIAGRRIRNGAEQRTKRRSVSNSVCPVLVYNTSDTSMDTESKIRWWGLCVNPE